MSLVAECYRRYKQREVITMKRVLITFALGALFLSCGASARAQNGGTTYGSDGTTTFGTINIPSVKENLWYPVYETTDPNGRTTFGAAPWEPVAGNLTIVIDKPNGLLDIPAVDELDQSQAPVRNGAGLTVQGTAPKGRLRITATSSHSASMQWTADTDAPSPLPSGDGYNVYEQNGACPATAPTTAPDGFTKLTATPVTTTTYTDAGFGPGTRCYFVTFALSGAESPASDDGAATILPAAPGGFTITQSQ